MDSFYERMIAEYSEKLVEMSKRKKSVETKTEEQLFDIPTAQTEITYDLIEETSEKSSKLVVENVRSNVEDEKEQAFLQFEQEALEVNGQASEEGEAFFVAEVFAGGEAFPVANAKVVIKKDGNIIAFLHTDDIGKTEKITIVSPPKENSLEPYNTQKSIEYTADIYAEGFMPKENLLIEAVGGTNIILKTNMVPEPERAV